MKSKGLRRECFFFGQLSEIVDGVPGIILQCIKEIEHQEHGGQCLNFCRTVPLGVGQDGMAD